jgi:hypothetical protein
MNGPASKLARCAIYTRKSSEHNLDLAFNSLDALCGCALNLVRHDDPAVEHAGLIAAAL